MTYTIFTQNTPHTLFFAPLTSKFMQKKAPTLKGYTVKERIFQKN